jgi:hypothetical protein
MTGAQIHGKELLKIQVQGQPKNLVVLRGNGSTKLFDAHPLVEGFNAEHSTKLTVVSHKVADVILTVGGTWRRLRAFAVDASIAYETPGTKLGKEIVFSAKNEPRVVLATGKFKGEKNVALVSLGLASTEFKKDGNSITLDIPENRLILVPNFPGPNGFYLPHAETGVPHDEQVDQSSDARCLYRNDSSYVGLLVRYVYFHSYRQNVLASRRASCRLGVVAEVPEGDIAKIEKLIARSAEQPRIHTAKIHTANMKELLTIKKMLLKSTGISDNELKDKLEKTRQLFEISGLITNDLLTGILRELGEKFEALLSKAKEKN